jgi:hypothetical protein
MLPYIVVAATTGSPEMPATGSARSYFNFSSRNVNGLTKLITDFTFLKAPN